MAGARVVSTRSAPDKSSRGGLKTIRAPHQTLALHFVTNRFQPSKPSSRRRCQRSCGLKILSGALNPGFDVTPPELITGIITPVGIFKPQDLWHRRRELGFEG